MPTRGTKFYRFDGAWKKLYSEDFTVDEKKAIIAALDHAVRQTGYTAEKHWGEPIEDRDSQITFSALGQSAPLDEKEKWDPDFAKRKAIEAILAPLISGILVPFRRLRPHRAIAHPHVMGSDFAMSGLLKPGC